MPETTSAPPALDLDEASALLRGLADPTRLRIVAALRAGETCVCELASTLGLAENLVSHHLGVLRRLGLAVDRRDTGDGRWVYYRLLPDALAQAQHTLLALLDPTTLGAREPFCPKPIYAASTARFRGRRALPIVLNDDPSA